MSLADSGPTHGEKSQERGHPRDLQWVYRSEGLLEGLIPLDPLTAAKLCWYELLVLSAPTSLQVFLVLAHYHQGNKCLKDAPLFASRITCP